MIPDKRNNFHTNIIALAQVPGLAHLNDVLGDISAERKPVTEKVSEWIKSHKDLITREDIPNLLKLVKSIEKHYSNENSVSLYRQVYNLGVAVLPPTVVIRDLQATNNVKKVFAHLKPNERNYILFRLNNSVVDSEFILKINKKLTKTNRTLENFELILQIFEELPKEDKEFLFPNENSLKIVERALPVLQNKKNRFFSQQIFFIFQNMPSSKEWEPCLEHLIRNFKFLSQEELKQLVNSIKNLPQDSARTILTMISLYLNNGTFAEGEETIQILLDFPLEDLSSKFVGHLLDFKNKTNFIMFYDFIRYFLTAPKKERTDLFIRASTLFLSLPARIQGEVYNMLAEDIVPDDEKWTVLIPIMELYSELPSADKVLKQTRDELLRADSETRLRIKRAAKFSQTKERTDD